MKIVFTTEGNTTDSKMDPRLGRAKGLLVTEDDLASVSFVNTDHINQGDHGVGPKMIAFLDQLKADVVITGNGPGQKASQMLGRTSMKVFVGAGNMTVAEAFDKYREGALKQFE